MKKLFSLITMGIFGSAFSLANAQEPADTLQTHELNEVVVEAQMQRTNATSTTYIPTKRQKDAAQDAVSLLSQMALPQIDVNPVSSTIKTNAGQTVSIFIDYIPATEQDLAGMQTKDVKKVEYLLYPTDPRFQNAQYVINFVMQKYEWGGYTKISADKWFGVNRSEGSVYSKFNYKRMTFDLYADEIYLTNRHTGVNTFETFRFTDWQGKGPQNVERSSTLNSSLYRNNSADITFRALYFSEKIQSSNRLSYTNNYIPHNDQVSTLEYANGVLPSGTASNLTSNKSWGLNYDSNNSIRFNDHLSANIEAQYQYDHHGNNSEYLADGLDITNDAIENLHHVKLAPYLLWNPNKRNTVAFILDGEYYRYDINYLGYSPSRQLYDLWAFVVGGGYSYRADKWIIGTQVLGIYSNNTITGNKIVEFYPQGFVYASWSPNDKNQFELRYSYEKSLPDPSKKSPNMLRQDELMWYSGNVFLKSYWNHGLNASYTWLPNNKYQLSADGGFYPTSNQVVNVYRPDGPDGTMLRKYENDGDYNLGRIALTGTGKFLNGKLIARINPQLYFYHRTGDYAYSSKSSLLSTAQLTWYFGNFYLFGWMCTPYKTYEMSGYINKTPISYQIQFGWGKGAWRARATASNFLRSSWKGGESMLHGQYYDITRQEFGTQSHQRFQFSVSYTFGYGKKVQQGDEVSGSGLGKSAILK